MTEARLQPILVDGRCVGHTLASSRGYRAFDAKDNELGTFSTAEAAIDAIAQLARGGTRAVPDAPSGEAPAG